MANLSSIARPYALAAFEYARDAKQLAEWKAFLMTAAMVTRHPSVQRLLANPEVTSDKLYSLYEHALTKMLTQEGKNFLRLLAQKRRLNALPEIVEAYGRHIAALEQVSTARVITAVESNEIFQHALAKALSKKTQREVQLLCEVDPDIIGGAIIHIGDNVIDGSVRGKLNRLLEFILR